MHAVPDSASRPTFARGTGLDVSVVIVSYNTAHLIERCIAALRRASAGLAVGLVVVDNASRDGSVAAVRRAAPDAVLVENAVNVGFGRANNQALAHAQGRHLLLLNADAYVEPDTLHLCVDYLDRHPECGVLGALSVDERGRPSFAGRSFPTPWRAFAQQTGLFGRRLVMDDRYDPARPGAQVDGALDTDWVVGCFYLVRREALDRVGLFDPRYFLYFEEVDHCRAVRDAGYAVRCLPAARVVHEGGGSASSDGALDSARQISAYQVESGLLYFRKHGGLAGALWTTALWLLADVLLAFKSLLKGRPFADIARHARSIGLTLRLFLRTRAGRTPVH